MAVIKLANVSKNYQLENQPVPVLNNINMDIHQGEIMALVGRSGSGKTTLLHIIGTLERPTTGQVYLDGVDVSRLKDDQVSKLRNQKVGFVFQTNNLLPEFTALENVMMPGMIAGAPAGQLKKRAQALLSAVDLGHRESHRPTEMSGGEQQRVAIARALLMGPSILLADEPTGNLDHKTSSIVKDLLLQLCAAHKITMLLVTHDLELAQSLPKQVMIKDGQLENE